MATTQNKEVKTTGGVGAYIPVLGRV